uniref:Uncharacterized protein n=1 Tax=Glossina pallidipes TaxID=7398 RepID=A0A1A9ZUE2_GLOPL
MQMRCRPNIIENENENIAMNAAPWLPLTPELEEGGGKIISFALGKLVSFAIMHLQASCVEQLTTSLENYTKAGIFIFPISDF